MKSKILIAALITLFSFGCKSDKQTQLARLKKERDKITERINTLEREISSVEEKKEVGKMVTINEIQPAPFSHYIDVQGRLDGDENVSLTSPIGGTVKAIFVKAGENVKKGQIIAELNHDAQSAQLKALEAQLKAATEVFEKTQRLWDQKIGSEVQYIQAKALKENLENNAKAIREQIDMLILRSPIDGAVEDMPLKVGQMAAASIPTTYVKIVGFNRLKVVADVAEGYSAKIKKGDKVRIYFPDITKEYNATINFASRYINPVNRTFTVEAVIESLPFLKANMIAMLKIVDYNNEKALSVPFNYIQGDKNGYYIFVADNGKAKRVNVKIGQIYNGTAEIIDGIKAGDKIITSGFLDLEEGQAVRF